MKENTHGKHNCPICYAEANGLNVYELVGFSELTKWTQIHNEALGIKEQSDEMEECDECGREIPVAEFDSHECDHEDIAARAADRREAMMEAYD